MNSLKGGQGRSEEDIYGTGIVLAYMLIAVAASGMTMLIMWCVS